MTLAGLSPIDQSLHDLASVPAATSIAKVIACMEAIDGLLPHEDGLKWFNWLYLTVTRQVDLQPPGGAWQSPAWLTRLDVVFAGLYFGAITSSLEGSLVPSSWSAFFEARHTTGIDRIQFALAGMNAHINHDLALALVATNTELDIAPSSASPEHTDYQSVNQLLNTLMPATLAMLATDCLGVVAQDTGKLGRILAFWNICRARDLAWDFGGHLRELGGFSRNVALTAQDAMTGALGRAILINIETLVHGRVARGLDLADHQDEGDHAKAENAEDGDDVQVRKHG